MTNSISFNTLEMEETLIINKKIKKFKICENFLNILSLDIDYIKKNLIDTIDFNDYNSIKDCYNKIRTLEPLLSLSDYDIFEKLNNLNDVSHNITILEQRIFEIDHIIMDLKLKYQSYNNNDNKYLLNLIDKSIDEKNKMLYNLKIYKKISNNVKQYVENIFKIISTTIYLYREIIEICFFNKNNCLHFEGYSELTPMKKFIFYSEIVLKKDFFKDLPNSSIEFNFECHKTDFLEKLKSFPEQNALRMLFNENVRLEYTYILSDLNDFLKVSLLTYLTLNIPIKKCNNCNKYFLAYNRSDEKYCNRISPQENSKTCKQYGSNVQWQKKLDINDELKLYRKIYMTKQMRSRRNSEFKQVFEIWKTDSKTKKNELLQNLISKDDFIKWLEKS